MIQQDNQPKTPRDYMRLFFTGIAMGSADIVPGVSGGTMAFILGVYESLLDAIKAFSSPDTIKLALQLKIKAVLERVPWQFFFTLVLGIATAVLSLVRIISYLLDNESEYLFAFFFGLVVASIIAVAVRIETWSPTIIAGLIAGTAIALFIVTQTPTKVEPNAVNLFFSGALAIVAMILPGISGSFILLILGQYDNALNAVKNFEIVHILALGMGCTLGLALFVRLLSWLLKHYHQTVIALLVGFMIGSLWKIWPWREVLETNFDRHGEEFVTKDKVILPNFGSSEFWFALLLVIVGFVIVTLIDHLQSKNNPVVLALMQLHNPK